MNIKSLLAGIAIGAVSLPVIAGGSSFVASLIQGKTPEEAVVVLADQMDILIGRVDIIESNQANLTQSVSNISSTTAEQEQAILNLQSTNLELEAKLIKEESCRKRDTYQKTKEKIDYYLKNGLIKEDLSIIDPLDNGAPNQLDREKYQQTLVDYQKYLESTILCP